MTNRKVDENDVTVINNIQSKYNELLVEAGQIFIAQSELDNARKDFEKRLFEFRTTEQDVTKRMSQKYGDGTIDLEKNEFISN
jgi:hypothetical protein